MIAMIVDKAIKTVTDATISVTTTVRIIVMIATIATIAVIGLIVGLTTVRNAIVAELSDVAGAVQDLNQSYTYAGATAPGVSTQGSDYDDNRDFNDSAEDPVNNADNGITFTLPPTDE